MGWFEILSNFGIAVLCLVASVVIAYLAKKYGDNIQFGDYYIREESIQEIANSFINKYMEKTVDGLMSKDVGNLTAYLYRNAPKLIKANGYTEPQLKEKVTTILEERKKNGR